MRRPGIWVANGTPSNPEQMFSWRPGALTCFYDYLSANRVHDYKARQPDTTIIVRFQHPRRWWENPAGSAQNLGRHVASRWPEIRNLDPYVYFANEMNLHYENDDPNVGNQSRYTTPEFYERFAAWVRLTAEVIKNEAPDMKLVTPPFAFGHHEDGAPDDSGHPTEGWAGYDFMAEAIRDYFDNLITFHSYWGHSAGSVHDWLYDPVLSTWYAHRWQRVLKLFETRYNILARVIIDEAGNFAASDPDFSQQVIDHATVCLTDPRVLAVTYFLWEDPTLSPGNLLNSWTQKIANLSQHVARLAALPDFPEAPPRNGNGRGEPTIRVLFDDGTVRVMLLEEYLRAVVPAEVPALWPAEAVKAQAVAARTYAQYRVEHPRHPDQGADICTNPAHCQNYDPRKIHVASDEAILATDGLVAKYDQKTIDALFSANCGGHTKNSEDVFSAALPYLRGVPCPNPGPKNGHGVGLCQHGARTFADQGRSFDQILKHYYRDITLTAITVPQTGTLRGFVLDLLDVPVPEVQVVLNGTGQAQVAKSATDGSFGFENLPPGTYRLSLPDFELERSGLVVAAGEETVVNFAVELASPQGFTMTIQRFSGGLPLLVGNVGDEPGIELTIVDPFGNTLQVRSGSKPEYGAGGFEIYAPLAGDYVVHFLGESFRVPLDGRFSQVTFTRRERPQPAGSRISGILLDFGGQAVAGQVLILNRTGSGAVSQTTTDANGRFGFEGLAAGAYTIEVESVALERPVTVDGTSPQVLEIRLPAAPPPPAPQWQMEIERGPGLPLLVGDIGQAGQMITITDPRGFQTQVASGSKPEFGTGGFELYATQPGVYTIQFLNETFSVTMDGKFTRVTFRQVSGQQGLQVRLVSRLLPEAQARSLLSRLDAERDMVELFTIEET
jgi:hypothetical protein